DFRAVIGQTHTNILFDVCIPVKFSLSDFELCEKIAHGIRAKDETCNTIITVDRSYISNTIDSGEQNDSTT
ncbi:MAG: cation-efflux pump, partial [Oscillospiraceae bacterium]